MDPSVATVIAAGISFVAGVAAVVIGQLLNGHYQRTSDDRRWEREEVRRRTLVAEERARQCRLELLAAANEISHEAGRQRAHDASKSDPPSFRRRHAWDPPLDPAVMRSHLAAAEEAALEINEPAIRNLVGKIRVTLSDYHTGVDLSEMAPAEISTMCVEAVNAAFGAFLRGEPLPPTPDVDRMVAALEEEDQRLDAHYREEAARRAAEREARRAESDATDG